MHYIGLHQLDHCWHHDLHDKLFAHNFTEIAHESCIHSYKSKAIVLVYMDNLPIFSKDEVTLKDVVDFIKSIYEVKNQGKIKLLLRVEFSEKENELHNLNC